MELYTKHLHIRGVYLGHSIKASKTLKLYKICMLQIHFNYIKYIQMHNLSIQNISIKAHDVSNRAINFSTHMIHLTRYKYHVVNQCPKLSLVHDAYDLTKRYQNHLIRPQKFKASLVWSTHLNQARTSPTPITSIYDESIWSMV